MSRPLLSVICPTYNRPEHVAPLLDSVLAQDFDDWECVIAEDCSPARDRVKAICDEYTVKSNGRIRCHLNEENLGYDGSFRKLIELARGRYVFVMGDDDYVAPGAFRAVADAIAKYPDVGMILRAHAYFRDTPENVYQINRFYPGECSFPAGQKAIVACYRRLVSMSGLVFDRDLSQSFATDRWDGSLFYQHWLAANILVTRPAVYIPQLLAYFRRGAPTIFGNAKAEQGLYTPGAQPPDTDLKMVGYLMSIAETVERERGVKIAALIRQDFGNYMYPTIAHQAHEPWPVFFRFYRDLGRMGFDRNPLFHFWFWSIAVLGPKRIDGVLQAIRRRVGHTPNITRFARRARLKTTA
jgi:glycosyltransferase involved in cell wall biosynthesis